MAVYFTCVRASHVRRRGWSMASRYVPMTDRYPDQIEAWHAAIARLQGVRDVCSGIQSVWGIKGEHLSSFDFGELPHAVYRRTDGGLENETLIQTEFRLVPKSYSWRTLEFVAWWVRDQARGGELIQLRPFGLPPVAGVDVQLRSYTPLPHRHLPTWRKRR